MKTLPNDLAYPSREDFNELGLTKREYFAAMAMQGLMTHDSKDLSYDYLTKIAVLYADVLIVELNKSDQ